MWTKPKCEICEKSPAPFTRGGYRYCADCAATIMIAMNALRQDGTFFKPMKRPLWAKDLKI